MVILGMGPKTLVVGGLGAHFGSKIARDTLVPKLAGMFPNLIAAPDPAKLGVYDVLIGVGAVLGAALANKLVSNAL